MRTRLLVALTLSLMLWMGAGTALAYSGPPLIVRSSSRTNSPALAIDGDQTTGAMILYDGGWVEYEYADGRPRLVTGFSKTDDPMIYNPKPRLKLIDASGQVLDNIEVLSSSGKIGSLRVLRYRLENPSSGNWKLYDFQPQIVVPPPPAAPQDLTAQVSTQSIALAWRPPTSGSSPIGYRVYRDGSPIAEVTGTSYSDQAVTPGSSYSYTVTAYNEDGESSHTGPQVATVPIPPAPPAPPQAVEVGPVSSSGVSISWQVPSSGGVPTGYRVYRDGSPVAEVTGTSYSDQAVTPGSSYSYTVTAYNESGESAPAEAVTVTIPTLPAPPHTPAGVTASTGARQVTISWQHPGGGGPVDHYRVYRDGALLGVTQTTTWTDTKLTPQTAYAYAVSSVNQAGESERATVSVRTSDPGVIDGVVSTLADLGPQVAQAIEILLPFFLVGAGLVIAQRVLTTGAVLLRSQYRGRRH